MCTFELVTLERPKYVKVQIVLKPWALVLSISPGLRDP